MISLWLAGLAIAGALSEGAEAFDAGNLDGAIEAWEAEGDSPSGRVLYGLGNAWYRKGDHPRAVAHFRAAQRLRPRDGNIHHNLALARSELAGVPEPAGSVHPWTEVLTVGELGVLAAGTCAAGSLGLIWGFRRREEHQSMGLVVPSLVWVGGLVLTVTASTGARDVQMHPVGVVVEREVGARELPRADAEVRVAWAPGTELRVVERGTTWVLAEDGRGRRGWVSDTAMLIVWPRR
jgi:hypothetical protein